MPAEKAEFFILLFCRCCLSEWMESETVVTWLDEDLKTLKARAIGESRPSGANISKFQCLKIRR